MYVFIKIPHAKIVRALRMDGFRKGGRGSCLQNFVVYSYDVHFILFLFLICLIQIAKPLMHTTSPNGYQKYSPLLKMGQFWENAKLVLDQNWEQFWVPFALQKFGALKRALASYG